MSLPVITPLTPDDLDAIMALERQVFADPWTRRMYLADLTENGLATYLAVRPDGNAGEPNQASRRQVDARPPAPGSSAPPLPESTPSLPPILAWGGFWLMVDEAHIATVASHPDWRGCGLGQWLMLALLDAASGRGALAATLEVRAGNLAARSLYEKLGFEVVGRRHHYYRDGEDGLIMTTPSLYDPALQNRWIDASQDALTRLARCFQADTQHVGPDRRHPHDRLAG